MINFPDPNGYPALQYLQSVRVSFGLGGSSVMILSAHPGPPARHPHIADRTRLDQVRLWQPDRLPASPLERPRGPGPVRIRQVWAILTLLLSLTGSGRALESS